jgi:hypothetical protein
VSDQRRVRVVLAVCANWAGYFEGRRPTVGKMARRALRIAARPAPGAGVDVVLYGRPRERGGPTTARSRVTADGYGTWAREWVTRPNADRAKGKVLGEPLPLSRVEEAFGFGGNPWGSDAFDAVVAIEEDARAFAEASNADDGDDGDDGDARTLVLFWLSGSREESRKIVRFLHARRELPSAQAVFWSFFTHAYDSGPDDVWRASKAHDGTAIPNVRFSSAAWPNRRMLRAFSRWRDGSSVKR